MFEAIRQLGFPVGIVAMMVLGCWRGCKWAAPRLEEWGNRLVASHERLVASSIAIGESNSQTLRKIETVQAAQTAAVHRIETTLDELRKQHHPPIHQGGKP
jgi:hypothetical protein